MHRSEGREGRDVGSEGGSGRTERTRDRGRERSNKGRLEREGERERGKEETEDLAEGCRRGTAKHFSGRHGSDVASL